MSEQKSKNEQDTVNISPDEARALLLGVPKDEFAAVVCRLSSWLQAINLPALPRQTKKAIM
ncbi:hypothetical protein [Shinella sp.]|uniref:hypothetical protein n=1 Tax=Shinella sp. TaxID=1870904 RepID=UPI0028A59A5B|nr:hypothetical protein [Shinella sp.]